MVSPLIVTADTINRTLVRAPVSLAQLVFSARLPPQLTGRKFAQKEAIARCKPLKSITKRTSASSATTVVSKELVRYRTAFSAQLDTTVVQRVSQAFLRQLECARLVVSALSVSRIIRLELTRTTLATQCMVCALLAITAKRVPSTPNLAQLALTVEILDTPRQPNVWFAQLRTIAMR